MENKVTRGYSVARGNSVNTNYLVVKPNKKPNIKPNTFVKFWAYYDRSR